MSSKYTITKNGIKNNKTGKFTVKNPINKDGKLNKKFLKLSNELKASQLNDVVKTFNITPSEILNNVSNKNIIYDNKKLKFYNKDWLRSRVDLNKRKIVNNRLLTESETNKNVKNYAPFVLRNLDRLNRGEIDKINFDLKNIKIQDLAKLLKDNVITNKKVVLNLGKNYYTLSNDFMSRLSKLDINKAVKLDGSKSEGEYYIYSELYDKVGVELIEYKKSQTSGQFFKYYNNTHFDFSKYGIFKEEDIDDNTYINNCLYNALYHGGMNNDKLTKFKLYVNNRNVPICKLGLICEELDISIRLTILKNLGNQKINKYGKNENEKYNIGLIDEHYFIIDQVEVTSYCLKNYYDIKDINECYKIDKKTNGKYKKSNTRFINSYELFKILLNEEYKLLSKIPASDLEQTQYISDVYEFDNLDYDESKNTKPILFKEPEKIEGYKIFFDFETWTDKNDDNNHKPYCVCYITEDGEKKYFYGEKCGLNMLYDIVKFNKDNIILIAHNAKYDYTFLSKYLCCENPLIKDGNFYNCKARFYSKKNKFYNVTIKDSYKLITMPLKKFGKCFKLDQSKEIMPYDLYNIDNPIINKFKNLDICLKYIKKEEITEYINNCIKFKCIYKNYELIEDINKIDINNYKDYQVDILKYSKEYCLIDCHVLKKGYDTFRKWMLEITKLDIDNIITIASLAHNYMIKQGVYNDCYLLSGIPRAFIQKCVVGGRVMCNNNTKHKTNEVLADYDACSLYPSAMDRLGDMGGYLKGKPKVLNKNQLNMNFLNNQDGYFIKILIKKVNILRDLPLLSKYTNENVRHFNNNMVGEFIYIDKIGLEDLIEFQKIEFDIIQGYYFNEGRNNKIKEVINYLYNERKIEKADKNPIQECYKLIMNSAYGKTILKPSKVTTKIIFVKNFEKFINYNYNRCREIKKINDSKYLVTMYQPINNQFNSAHIGTEILSMSKRIMNEVICLAEDNNIKIFYQDTDSLHLKLSDVPILEKHYFNNYGRVLNGKDMGQFHIDFDLDGADSEIYSKRSIFLGKKCYIDELECVNKNGSIVNGYHIRMKGVSNESILYECDKMNITPFELYNKLYNGDKVRFDLTAGGKKCCFQFENLSTVSTNNDFERDICFNDNNKETIPINRI